MRLGLLLTFGVILMSGCSKDKPLESAADPSKSRAALERGLDAWKAGQKPAELQSSTPKLHFGDDDWMRGRPLASYEIIGAGEPVGIGLRFAVTLHFDEPNNPGKRTRRVLYRVYTEPQLAISRDEG